MDGIVQIAGGVYRGTLGRGHVEIQVAPGPRTIVVRTNVYDGTYEYPYPRRDVTGGPPAGRGYDEVAVALAELGRLRALLAAGKNLWAD